MSNLEIIMGYPPVFWLSVAMLTAGMILAVIITFTPPRR